MQEDSQAGNSASIENIGSARNSPRNTRSHASSSSSSYGGGKSQLQQQQHNLQQLALSSSQQQQLALSSALPSSASQVKPTPRIGDGPILTLERVERDQAGIYQCTADNSVGEPVTVDMRLDVLCKCIYPFLIFVSHSHSTIRSPMREYIFLRAHLEHKKRCEYRCSQVGEMRKWREICMYKMHVH